MHSGVSAPAQNGRKVICPCCGKDIRSVQREIKLELPEAVLQVPAPDRKRRVGVGGSSFMQLDLKRFFVRALLPVRLSDGHEFHFGVWLETDEDTSRLLWEAWDLHEYTHARLRGKLANSVPPWNEAVLDSPCVASARNADQLPYITSSTEPLLASVLTTPWPREECERLLDQVWGHPDKADR